MTDNMEENKDCMQEQQEQEQEQDKELSDQAEELRQALLNGDFDIMGFLSEYKAAKAAAEEAEERCLRVQADFDNFRRRSRKDGEEAAGRGKAKLAEDLLPVLDNFQRAAGLMAEGADKEGVELILRQFISVLTNAGLTEIDALDKDFDPNLHHAVLQEPSEDKKGKVLMVLQKGYMMDDKLLRAAMVQVGV